MLQELRHLPGNRLSPQKVEPISLHRESRAHAPRRLLISLHPCWNIRRSTCGGVIVVSAPESESLGQVSGFSGEAFENRRSHPRYAPRAKVKFECRKGSSGLGANLASALLDLSQLGAKIVCKAEVEVGEEVEVTLVAPAFQKPVKVLANVMRTSDLKDGGCQIGVRFQRPISYADLRLLTNF